jgi:hypothetical protein
MAVPPPVTGATATADSPWTAAACWLGALFMGPLVPAIVLGITWRARGSLARRHALAATVLWTVLLAVYLPVFVVGMLIPAFHGESPRWWAIAVAIVVALTSWTATAVGLLLIWKAARTTAPAESMPGAARG